jgi:hypothetical protein
MKFLALAVAALCLSSSALAETADDFAGIWLRPSQKPGADPRGVNPPIGKPPLKEPYASAYAASERVRQQADDAGTPIATDKAQCLPGGMPYVMETSLPVEILPAQGRIVEVFEFNTQVRHIRLGDAHAGPDDLEFTFFGDSVGRFEGKDLIVDTIGVRTPTLLFARSPHGENLRIVERYHLLAKDLMKVTITMTDPDYFAAPWVVTRIFARQHDLSIREYVCLENQRNFVDAQGRLGSVDPLAR